MESFLIESNFRRRLRSRLDKLSISYLNSEIEFLKEFIEVPNEYLNVIIRSSVNVDLCRKSKYSDLIEYCTEVFSWYQSIIRIYFKIKENEIRRNTRKSFSLHNSTDLKRFESFLDVMLDLLNVSEEKFIKILPLCPVELWDKIDDLRETSFKSERDSEEYTRCLTKCKKISLTYFKLTKGKDKELNYEV